MLTSTSSALRAVPRLALRGLTPLRTTSTPRALVSRRSRNDLSARAYATTSIPQPGPHCAESFRTFVGQPEKPEIYCFWEKQTCTWQYVVADPVTLEALIIDPVLDFDKPSGKVSTETADCMLDFIERRGLKIKRIMETHAHADHLTSSQYLKSRLGDDIPVCIGKRITMVQDTFAPRYHVKPTELQHTFDQYLEDNETFKLGALTFQVMHLPGHTPDHIAYRVDSCVFTGDSIFEPDVGSARADFPGGSAQDLYQSLRKLTNLPDEYKLFVGHDYPPEGREPNCVSTVGTHKATNKHINEGVDKPTFIQMREERDKSLSAPRLLHPSLQVNIRAGRVPEKLVDPNASK